MTPRWVAACAGGEALGMVAAATAARSADGLPTAAAVAVVVSGGLVEGTGLGLLQARALSRRTAGWRLGRPERRAWVLVTVVVAGLGWAAGSVPSVLSDDGSSATSPPLAFVLLAAAGIGLVLGAALGAAQAHVLRRLVRHPWRWVAANAGAWPVAMAVIFGGATTAGAAWSWPVLLGYAALTGAAAGAALGFLTAPWLDALGDPPGRGATLREPLVKEHAT